MSVVVDRMQNNYYKAQNHPYVGFVPLLFECSYVFHFSDTGCKYVHVLCVSVYDTCECLCVKMQRIWVLPFPFREVRVCLWVSEMSPSNLRSTNA